MHEQLPKNLGNGLGITPPVRVVVGSSNPAKLRPVQAAFAALYPGAAVSGQPVPSGVPDQPIGMAQTAEGAVQRARAAQMLAGEHGWGVGLEGGVLFGDLRGEPVGSGGPEHCWLFGVVAVVGMGTDGGERLELGHSARLRLPPRVAARLRAGEELGPVMDQLSGVHDIKQKAGTVGLLTRDQVHRADIWQQALTLALAPLLNPQLYRDGA